MSITPVTLTSAGHSEALIKGFGVLKGPLHEK